VGQKGQDICRREPNDESVEWQAEGSVNTRSTNRNQGNPERATNCKGVDHTEWSGLQDVSRRIAGRKDPMDLGGSVARDARGSHLLGTRRVQRVTTPQEGDATDRGLAGPTERPAAKEARGQGLKGTLGITACMSEPEGKRQSRTSMSARGYPPHIGVRQG